MDVLIKKLVKERIIQERDIELYRYGLECMSLKALHYLSYIIIALCMGRIVELGVFLLVFGILRKNAGGFHSRTRRGCYIFSCIVIFGFLRINAQETDIWLNTMLLIIADGIIWMQAPVNGGSMELDIDECIYYRKRSRRILIGWNLLYILTVRIQIDSIARIISEACFLEALLLEIALFISLIQKTCHLYRQG